MSTQRGVWVTNTPKKPDPGYFQSLDQDPAHYWEWRRQFVVGPPSPSGKATEAMLREWRLVGLYRRRVEP